MITSLLRPEAYDHPVDRVELLETHISWVLLTGQYAYKIKKPVNFGFVDFGTVDRRRWFCEEEVRLNRRLAAPLYCGLAAIHGPASRAAFTGGGEVIDWAVRMRQFPQEALAAEALTTGRLEPRHWLQLGDEIAAFQEAAAIAGPCGDQDGAANFGLPEGIRSTAQANLDVLADCRVAAPRWLALQPWTDRTFECLRPIFIHRHRTGRIREGHGDLHLGNLVFLDDHLTAFDCLEFNPELRWIDVISELAFLSMDLAEHGDARDATRLLNRWLDRTGDYAGLSTWRWYVVYRALVRAKVNALRLRQPPLEPAEAARIESAVAAYVTMAEAAMSAPPGRLIITHGVSGSGKSHLSRQLAAHFGWIHLRSDAERKRLFGLWGVANGEPDSTSTDLYRPEISERLYGEVLPDFATAVVKAGFNVIVDATFLCARHRAIFADAAARAGTTCDILHCRVSTAVAQQRIVQRMTNGVDPSDADAAVLERQLSAADPLSEEERTRAIVIEPMTSFEAAAAAIAGESAGPRNIHG